MTVVQNPAGYADEDSSPAKNLLPTKYATPQTSGLTVTVKPGANEMNFELKK